MDRAHWQTLSQLLDEALPLDAPARRVWLDALRQHDAALAARLETLLARDHDDAHSSPMTAARQFAQALEASETPRDAAQPGQLFGPWAVRHKLGSGGMGEVWLAERVDELYEGQAAIKLLKAGGEASRLVRRFARERKLLARLAHPGIARLLDAGVSNQQPYLVLEYVPGQPLLQYAHAAAPTVEARLHLVIAIAEAVGHAHSQLIVHRDLKPSNVLVTPQGEIKLLDFGIAGLLESAGEPADTATSGTDLTRHDGRSLTLDYAAPEQVTGEATGVACDVFSLGVMLFELLSGQRPFAGRQPGRAALEHAIVHDEPQRLSRVLAGPPPAAAGARPSDVQRACGPLEAVIAKALRKQPEQRYTSVAAFAADLRRWLEHRPVGAVADDWRYRSRLWLRRNRVVMALSLAAVLSLAAGLVVSQQQLRRAQAAEARAEAASATAESVTQYFTDDLLAVASDSGIDTKTLTVLQLFETMARRADTSLVGEPEVIARVRLLLGTIFNYYGGGRPQELAEIAKAHQSLMQVGERDPHRALALLQGQDTLYYVASLSDDDLKAFEGLVARAAAQPAPSTAARRQLVTAQLAVALDAGQQRDDAVGGLALLDTVLASPQLEADQRWEARRSRARMLWLLDRTAPALAQYRQLLADPLAATLLSDRHEMLRMRAQMGRLMLELGETDAAEKELTAFAELLQKTAVTDSIPVLRTQLHLAYLRMAQRRPAEAVALLRGIDPFVQQRIRTAGPSDAPFMIELANEQVDALRLAGQPREALLFSQQMISALEAAIAKGADADSSAVLRVRILHAAALVANGQPADARTVLAGLSAAAIAHQPAQSPIRCELLQVEAAVAEASGDRALAVQKLEAAERMLTAVFNAESWRVQAVRAARQRLGAGA